MDEITGTPTEPQPGTWILPGRITERATAGNRWIEPGGMECLHCHGKIAGPTYYRVVFDAAPGPNGERYSGIACDTCSRECAEQYATLRPTYSAGLLPTEGNPTDPAVRSKVWIHAFRAATGSYPDDTDRSGKWLVFLPADEIDAFWARVREAIQSGRLGDQAKVATRAKKDLRDGVGKHVVCIYTYDHDDRADVWRIRAELRELGVTWRIYYKADEATMNGRYAAPGQRVSLYAG